MCFTNINHKDLGSAPVERVLPLISVQAGSAPNLGMGEGVMWVSAKSGPIMWMNWGVGGHEACVIVTSLVVCV